MTTPADGVGPFAVLLQQFRQAAGLSQEELAERAGLSARGISDLERGVRRQPYAATTRRLAAALGLNESERVALLAAARRSGQADVAPAQGQPTRAVWPMDRRATNLRTIDSRAQLLAVELADGSERWGRGPIAPGQPTLCPVLVGRDAELARLEGWLDQAGARTGRTILISGEPGIGKSGLVAAARQRAIEAGLRVLEGHCFETDRALPYGPVADLLRNWVYQQPEQDLARNVRPEVAAAIVQLAPELAPILPAIAPPTPLDPEHEQQRLFHTLAGWFADLTDHGPVLLILEDLHWSDESSLEFLLQLARRVAGLRMLVLLTYRSDEVHASLRQILAEFDRRRLGLELPLGRLGRADLDAMLRAILAGDRPIRTEFLDTLEALTDGNPFFVEELLGALVADGDLSSTAAGWRWRTRSDLPIPRTIQDAVQRRVDRLQPSTRRTVELAAVTGRRFDFALLAALTAHPEPELVEEIKELIGAQLVVEEALDRFAFRHALTREAIYTSLLGHERRVLHQRVAETLGRQSTGFSDASVMDLAYHNYQAACWEPALVYAQRAGDQALAAQAPAAAAELFSWAVDAALQLGVAPPPVLWRARGRAYEMLGDFERARTDLESALSEARTSGDRPAEWHALLDLGFLWAARDFDRAGEYQRQALELGREMGDLAALAQSLNRLGNWHLNIEHLAEARRYHVEALDIFERLADARGLAETHDLLGMTSYIQGDLVEAATHYRGAFALFEELHDRRGLGGAAELLMACAGTLQCDSLVAAPISRADARGAGELALRLAHETGWRAGEADARAMLGYYLGLRGEYAGALGHARAALDIAEEIEHRLWMTSAHVLLGLLHLDLFAQVQARWHLERAFELAQEMGSRVWICEAAGFLAWACVGQHELDRAERVLEEALGPAPSLETVGQRNCWVGHAELALARCEPARALESVEQLIVSAPNASPGRPIARLEHLRAQALAGLGRHAEAEGAWDRARAAAADAGARPLLWRIHAQLGLFYDAQSRRADAVREYGTARLLVDELAAGLPDERLRSAFREHAQARVPRPDARMPTRAKGAVGASPLSQREVEVLRLVTTGRSNREIADDLVLSVRTVERHLANIYTKLGVSGRVARAAAAAYGATHGLGVPPIPPASLPSRLPREDT